MKARVNRRSVLVAGVVATIGALVIGASAFAGGRPATRASRGHTLAITQLGQTATAIAAGTTREIKVLDAGTIDVAIDGTTATFRIGTVTASPGWTALATVQDGTRSTVVFTKPARRIEVSLVLDADVLVVTITEVQQGPTSSTTSAPTSSSSSSSPSTVATTTPTTAPPTTVGSTTVASTAVATTVASTTASTVATVACQNRNEGDDEQGDDECDDDEQHTTTQSSATSSKDRHDDEHDDEHEGKHEGKHNSHDD